MTTWEDPVMNRHIPLSSTLQLERTIFDDSTPYRLHDVRNSKYLIRMFFPILICWVTWFFRPIKHIYIEYPEELAIQHWVTRLKGVIFVDDLILSWRQGLAANIADNDSHEDWHQECCSKNIRVLVFSSSFIETSEKLINTLLPWIELCVLPAV